MRRRFRFVASNDRIIATIEDESEVHSDEDSCKFVATLEQR